MSNGYENNKQVINSNTFIHEYLLGDLKRNTVIKVVKMKIRGVFFAGSDSESLHLTSGK